MADFAPRNEVLYVRVKKVNRDFIKLGAAAVRKLNKSKSPSESEYADKMLDRLRFMDSEAARKRKARKVKT